MKTKINNNNEILENKLKDVFGIKNNFSTPENYFDTLPNEINDKISTSNSKTFFKISIFTYKHIALGLSVLIILIAVSGSILYIVKDNNILQSENIITLNTNHKIMLSPSINDSIKNTKKDSIKLEKNYISESKDEDRIDLSEEYTDDEIMEYLDEDRDNDIFY